MKHPINLILLFFFSIAFSNKDINAKDILYEMDKNLFSKNRYVKSKMIIHGRRSSRTIESETWSSGIDKAFTLYLSPPREAGTKMLKDNDKLWTYSPQTDRTIQISGHMLRQSVMGSDMSYNDMMEDNSIQSLYTATLEGVEKINAREHYILLLEAKKTGLAYPSRRAWVDAEYFLPMKEELYAKSGKLLKSTSMDKIKKIDNRWFPSYFYFKDELKRNSKGTEWIIDEIKFDIDIPDNQFSKSKLKK